LASQVATREREGDPTDEGQRLIDHRRAEVISISEADAFFSDLHQKVEALEARDPPHPLSLKTAVATIKRFLVDDRHRIDLTDLVMAEVERVVSATSDEQMPVSGTVRLTEENIKARVAQYEAIASTLVALVSTGAYWGNSNNHGLWGECITRLWPRTDPVE